MGSLSVASECRKAHRLHNKKQRKVDSASFERMQGLGNTARHTHFVNIVSGNWNFKSCSQYFYALALCVGPIHSSSIFTLILFWD
jgi:hypothetical protein